MPIENDKNEVRYFLYINNVNILNIDIHYEKDIYNGACSGTTGNCYWM